VWAGLGPKEQGPHAARKGVLTAASAGARRGGAPAARRRLRLRASRLSQLAGGKGAEQVRPLAPWPAPRENSVPRASPTLAAPLDCRGWTGAARQSRTRVKVGAGGGRRRHAPQLPRVQY
jgi:hypothetical protein